MPIGVPRIIYCWGEELPPQWTDIYNFIFRRRMVFLMQYLDDELCNQICGLLINIHMEDRSKELEKKNVEKSTTFKSANQKSGKDPYLSAEGQSKLSKNSVLTQQMQALSGGRSAKKEKSMEDLLSSYGSSIYEEDLAIDENFKLEQYTLQKITFEWLNWNAQFFNYADEPYLFYLTEILSKNPDLSNDHESGPPKPEQGTFSKDDSQLLYQINQNLKEGLPFKTGSLSRAPFSPQASLISRRFPPNNYKGRLPQADNENNSFDIYSPFRSIVNVANLISKDKNFSIKNLLPSRLVANSDKLYNASRGKQNLRGDINQMLNRGAALREKHFKQWPYPNLQENPGLAKLVGVLASKNLVNKTSIAAPSLGQAKLNYGRGEVGHKQLMVPGKALGQRNLRREYSMDNSFQSRNGKLSNDLGLNPFSSFMGRVWGTNLRKKALSFLDFDSTNGNQSYLFSEAQSRNEFSRKQTQKGLQEEESKKVFVVINSFGGSVGNGVTVHDALQFIKAGSLTLGLGVAASAASLVLAGGTISERYVSEGCHVMIHQPETSVNGQASDIWIDSQEIMKIRLDVAEIYSLSAHRPRHRILRDLDRDFYLTASEALSYGIADEIATNAVMHEIIAMTSKVWSYHDNKQQLLLESRDSANAGSNTQLQN